MGYREIAANIREQITSGEIPRGAKLPSNRDLMATHGAALATVQKAISLLASEGLVVGKTGSGTFVREQPRITRISRQRFYRSNRDEGLAAYLAEAEATGRSASVEILDIGGPRNDAPAWVTNLLEIEADAPVLVRYRKYLSDGRPDQIATSYIPWELAEGTAMVDDNPGPGGIYARLEEAGHNIERFAEGVETRMPTPEERDLLESEPGSPVLVVTRVAHGASRPVEVCWQIKTGDRWSLLYEWDAE